MSRHFHLGISCLALALSGSLGSGCASVISYQPKEKLVDEIGVQEAGARLQAVMTRAVSPTINAVGVNEDSFTYNYLEQYHGPYGIPVGGAPRSMQIFYVNMSKVEIYDNHYVFIYAPNNTLMSQVLFANEEDAKLYADIIMSFRARKQAGGGGAAPAPAPAPSAAPTPAPK